MVSTPFYQTAKPIYKDLPSANWSGLHLLTVHHALQRCLFLLLILLGNEALAQQPVMQHWSQAEGLASNAVFNIAQDRHGYIWLGHERGLSRFDGRDVVTYTHPKMNGAAVSNVFEDSLGRIWCQNFIGQLFYVLNDSMYADDRLPVSGNYAPMVLDNSGNIVSGFGQHITYYDPKELRPIRSASLKSDVSSIAMLDSSLWAMTLYQLNEYRGRQLIRTILLQGMPRPAHYLIAKVGNSILAAPKISNGGVIYQVLPSIKPMKVLPTDHVVQTIKVFGDSMVWIGTTGGLYILDAELKPYLSRQPLLAGHSISDVMLDRNGAFWVSTINRGIFRIPDLHVMQWEMKDEVFTVFAHRDDAPGLLIGTESGGAWQLSADQPLQQHIPPQAQHRVVTMLRDKKKDLTLMASDKLLGWRNGKQSFLQQGAVKDLMVLNDGRYLLAATGLLGFLGEDPEKDEPLRIDLGTYVFRCNALLPWPRAWCRWPQASASGSFQSRERPRPKH
jgi:ligand-binding sensor domain-containing protein